MCIGTRVRRADLGRSSCPRERTGIGNKIYETTGRRVLTEEATFKYDRERRDRAGTGSPEPGRLLPAEL